MRITLPETNIAPENRASQKETSTYSNHPFLGAMLVSGRVMLYSYIISAMVIYCLSMSILYQLYFNIKRSCGFGKFNETF